MRADGLGRMSGDSTAGPLLHVYDGIGWAGWWFLTLLVLILIGLVVGVVLALWRAGPASSSRSAAPAVGGSASAQQLLDERYAQGEIDEIEYLHRRAVLRGS